jgi:hypothetical protein
MNIKLHIERLVLDGIHISPADGPRLQAVIEAELVRLLSARGVNSGFQAGMALPSIRAGDMQLASVSSPNELGQRIAGALYGGIGK